MSQQKPIRLRQPRDQIAKFRDPFRVAEGVARVLRADEVCVDAERERRLREFHEEVLEQRADDVHVCARGEVHILP